MEPIRQHTGRVVPMMKDNIDTDQIMPKAFIKRISKFGYEDFIFFEQRYLDKEMTENPAFILNQEEYEGASILVAGDNFGCGSSREHAVWGLSQYGFKVVIAGSFSDIFYMNCTKNSLLPVVIEDDAYRQGLAELDPETAIEVDLEAQVIHSPLGDKPFEIDEQIKDKFLQGLDDITETLKHEDAIATYEAANDHKYDV
ncbi:MULTISPECIES: 3-isopropylmalate dehydratase small subunit [Aerococcus]|uniref:3-isopropylmalate dehydratase small subunit n=1 Tax=Aerococcus sanguinicola TaxID=119206 RepID=A0A5N1GQ45_9LACT|nr:MULTISPECIES: 3-isopropylmalate dehydratase small subunit [Aerococcus]KAA9300840.1 3-isopropylmalate dehydratase small subunit [Aerococcus sanguinicola]MDK6369371.1 3-isopropylmalate dehydratase small subunit [Aerococcus sp. UMB9870]MDK6679872.1 3-isopropylmalate dehydratase small subunit [Aerococcus sp. UMB8608]MDK6687606.1 3-isopropylmalate dehydratase small subunit [Aerococcus sp. UMB8623]MDK6939794.1 3-isopropylmalate dehydratase small subunit [Aerococcus sp. UMB8487]